MPQTINVPGVGQLQFPDGMSQADMAAAIQKNFPQIHAGGASDPSSQIPGNESALAGNRNVGKPDSGINWSDVPGTALANLLPSAGNFVGGIAQAVRHPIDTVGNVLDIGAGALQNLVPQGVKNVIDRIDPNPQSAQRAEAAADATGQFFKDRYGSFEGLKNTLATDPIGVASDASAVLTGGAMLAGKIPALAGAARAVNTVGNALNPINAAVQGVKMASPFVGNATAALVGNLGTHTGAESIKAAFDAGKRGGSAADSLADNMRGNVPMTDVLDAAKANLADMARQKSQAYRQGMAQVSGDQSVLSFAGIDQAISDAAHYGTYKGQVKNPKAAQVHQAITEAVTEWKALDPAEFHTPEGMDALKQRIGGILETIPFEEKTAALAGKNIYSAIKQEIVKQAPVYADTMKGYTDAAEQISEIERALSLGTKASVDTAMRKLQSLTRNNVNTNYGNRLELARELEQQGGREIMPALAGQALSSWTPRGLGNAVAGASGYGGYLVGGPMGAGAALAVQSPRLMGEASLASGRVAGAAERTLRPPLELLDRAGIDPALVANGLYQAGRLPHPALDNTPALLRPPLQLPRTSVSEIAGASTVDEAIAAAARASGQ